MLKLYLISFLTINRIRENQISFHFKHQNNSEKISIEFIFGEKKSDPGSR